jgi:hypothetical protein
MEIRNGKPKRKDYVHNGAKILQKIQSGLKLVIDHVKSIFIMINISKEADKQFIEEAYTYIIFLLKKHIQDKIGKEIRPNNIPRKIPERRPKKNNTKKIFEREEIEEDLRKEKHGLIHLKS